MPADNSSSNAGSRQYSTFYVDGLFFGIDVLEVQEVLRSQEMTRVPLSADVIQGLINLRGQIVTAIDMRRRLGLSPRADEICTNLVVRSDEGAVSLLVDEIGDVLSAGADTFEPPPENMAADHRALIDGIHKLEKKLLLILNRERVLQVSCES
jgi:purine-binding chemotaxis protein CheW